MGFDNAMEELATDESKFSVNGSSSPTDIVPAAPGVVGKGGIGVLKIGDCD
jgi:hypothetical protein